MEFTPKITFIETWISPSFKCTLYINSEVRSNGKGLRRPENFFEDSPSTTHDRPEAVVVHYPLGDHSTNPR